MSYASRVGMEIRTARAPLGHQGQWGEIEFLDTTRLTGEEFWVVQWPGGETSVLPCEDTEAADEFRAKQVAQ